jgi:hypothetical protein
VWETWASGRYSFGVSLGGASPHRRLMLYNRATLAYLSGCLVLSVSMGLVCFWKVPLPWGYTAAAVSGEVLWSVTVIRVMVYLVMAYQGYIADSSFWPPQTLNPTQHEESGTFDTSSDMTG